MLTRSEPVYYVTSGPTYGALQRHDQQRKPRDASSPTSRGRHGRGRKTNQLQHRQQQWQRQPTYISDAVMNFTHDDVVKGPHLLCRRCQINVGVTVAAAALGPFKK